ncbi:MAG: DUF4868 domain-containing protein [Ignavibacteriales bacterium]|nr:DUF4868 domain-containing protein [Ignavibacteriales bacterium]
MVDIKEFKELKKLDELKVAKVSLYLFENKSTKTNPITIYSLNIQKNAIAKIRTIGDDYLNEIDSIFKIDEMKSIPVYNPDSHQILFKMNPDEIKSFPEILEFVTGEKPCANYNKESIREDKIKSWILRFELVLKNRTEQLLIFQKFQPSKMLSQKFLTLFEKNKQFEMLDENILNINYAMDFLYYKNTFIVSKMSAFERVFGFHEYYKNVANELVCALTAQKSVGQDCKIIFEDTDDVKIKIDTNTRLAHKLFSANKNNYYKNIYYKKLVALNKKYQLKLKLKDDQKEWFVDKDADLKVVARVLNDDYEISQITDIEYLVDSKEVVK